MNVGTVGGTTGRGLAGNANLKEATPGDSPIEKSL